MRARLLLLFIATLAVGAPSLYAEDDPAPAPAKPAEEKPAPVEPAVPAPGDEAPKPDTSEEAAEESVPEPLMAPRQVLGNLHQSVRRMPRSERAEALKKGATEYLAKYEADATSSADATPADMLVIARLRELAQQWEAAVTGERAIMEEEENPMPVRAEAASALAVLLSRLEDGDAPDAMRAEALDAVTAYVTKTREPGTEVSVAAAYMALGRMKASKSAYGPAIAAWMRAAELNPALAYSAARSVARAQMGISNDLAAFPALKATGAGYAAVLEEIANRHVTALQGRLDERRENGEEAALLRNAQRSLDRAKQVPARISRSFKGLGLLGESAPDWTVDHAFSEVASLADLKGKVVMLDFWATWCPWCIRSFPAMRDLLKEYEAKGLVIVGITATSSAVWEERYVLDDDFQDLAEGNTPPVARLARNPASVDEAKGVLGPEAYKAREIEAIKTFIANHKMTWPVVMIDRMEPSAKYALTGWPHAVFLDRSGRVRYLKAGALLRSDKKTVAHVREILDMLLAESAEG